MPGLKELEALLKNGTLSRREFLGRVSALGITAALSPALFSKAALAATPKKGGRFRMGMGGGSTTDSLEPATITDAFCQNLTWQLRNNLVEVDYKGNPLPELSESFESTPDAAQWTFKLRKGIEFHNGKTLDAEDVIDSIQYHRGKDSKSAAKALLEAITEIKADGKNTVIFKLDGGNADFPFILAAYHLTIQPAGTRGAEFAKGIGTGPYQLVSFEPGVRAFVKKNPNYWKQGRGHFDEVETISIADFSARTNALQTGQVDAINKCDLKTVHLLKRSPNIQIIRTTGTRHYTMPMRCDVAPYDNNDVRLALKYAVDREQMVKLILRGYGKVANDHPIGPSQQFYASELPQREYDPEKAKYHMKKSRIGDHVFKLHAADAAFGGAVDAAALYKESAAKAGIKIEVVREPNDGYWSNVWMKKPWSTCFWSGRPTADWMFSTAYSADAKWNDSFWKHDRFNKLIIEARAMLDKKKRREMYVEMQKIVRDEGGVVVPMYADYMAATSKKVKFENPAGNFPLDGHKNTERWWFG
jgi:peptide/nickel transport system substrate-binding protein